MTKFKMFDPLNVSSKFAICGLPIRVDTYKTCSFGCIYCFSNHRKIMEFEKELQIGNINLVARRLDRVFNKNEVKRESLLDNLLKMRITWHAGGMSDPFQPIEKDLGITKQLIDESAKYGTTILFSTKSDTVYDCNINPKLHTFQFSVTNMSDRTDIEPNVPSIQRRIDFFKTLKRDGFKVGIRVQPFIPGVTKTDIVSEFKDADYFTIEGIKIVPQNKEHKESLLNILSINRDDFVQMGLLNLKPEIRKTLYAAFVYELNRHNIPFSIADNDMHHLSSGKCCCGDSLIATSTDFNNTALIHKHGTNYSIDDVRSSLSNVSDCKASHLFTSNRTEGCVTVQEFFEKRFDRASSPFSPKFLFEANESEADI